MAGLTIANMTTALFFTNTTGIQLLDLGLENPTSSGVRVEGADTVEISGVEARYVGPTLSPPSTVLLNLTGRAAPRDLVFVDSQHPVRAENVGSLTISGVSALYHANLSISQYIISAPFVEVLVVEHTSLVVENMGEGAGGAS